MGKQGRCAIQFSSLCLLVLILVVILAIYGNRNYLRSWERIRYSDADYVANSRLFNGTIDIAGESLPKWVEGKVYSAPKTLISDNKAILFPQPPGDGRMIEFPLTRGKHLISVRLIRTPIEMTADFISIISLIGLAIYGLKKK